MHMTGLPSKLIAPLRIPSLAGGEEKIGILYYKEDNISLIK